MCNWSSDLYFLSNIQIPANQLFSASPWYFLSITGSPKYEEPSEGNFSG